MRLSLILQIIFVLSSTGFLAPRFYIAAESELDEIKDIKDQLDDKEREIEELKKKEKEYTGAISEKRAKASTLEEVILDFNEKITKLESDIEQNKNEISDINIKIRQAEIEIKTREDEISRTKEFMGASIKEIYESSEEDFMGLLFQYENFSEFFSQVQYRYLLQNDLTSKLEHIKELKVKLEHEKQKLDSEKEKLNKLKKELEARNAILELQRLSKESLLRGTKNEEARFKTLLEDTRDKQEIIQNQIFELENKLREALDKTKIPVAIPGVLSWPTEGVLTQGYGCTEFAKTSKYYPTCFHNGIDIAASYGTPVKSARDGKVVAVANAPYAYGKWIAIEHDNGLVSMYAHLSLQSASVEKIVKRGEVIGYMGSTGVSTGSHLHFTVYAPGTFETQPSKISGTLPIGATLNPFDYLP